MLDLDYEFVHVVIPAAPGYWVHFVNREGEGHPISKPGFAVVAWVVQYRDYSVPRRDARMETYSTPVLSNGAAIDREYVIEQPDGTIVFPNGGVESGFPDAIDSLRVGRAPGRGVGI